MHISRSVTSVKADRSVSLYAGSFTRSWIIWGVIALVAITCNAIITLPPVRRLVYEFFLVSHILLNM
jgi:hypothetical protein